MSVDRDLEVYQYILVEIDECIANKPNAIECYVLDFNNKTIYLTDRCGKHLRCFVEYPYEEAYKIIYDPVRGVILRDFIVFKTNSDKGLYITKGSKIAHDVIEAYKVFIEITVGSIISYGDRIGYILTRKGEFRNIKSRVSGIVVYIAYLPIDKPQKVILLVVSDRNVEEVTFRGSR